MLPCRVCTFVVDSIGSTLKYSDELSASTSVYLGGGWRGQGTGRCAIIQIVTATCVRGTVTIIGPRCLH